MTFPVRQIIVCAAFCLLPPTVQANVIDVGALSYDTFIPAGGGSPGVSAFDLADLTGSYGLPPDFPVTDSLTLEAAVLTLTLPDSSQETFDLGDIGPGFLLDGSGNPVVQVPGDQAFASAEFTATVSPTTFMLYDGSLFAADSNVLDVLLLPSSGSALTVDVDQTLIGISGAPPSSVPEPASGDLALVGALGVGLRLRHLRQNRIQERV
jgi:hypothetical protein